MENYLNDDNKYILNIEEPTFLYKQSLEDIFKEEHLIDLYSLLNENELRKLVELAKKGTLMKILNKE